MSPGAAVVCRTGYEDIHVRACARKVFRRFPDRDPVACAVRRQFNATVIPESVVALVFNSVGGEGEICAVVGRMGRAAARRNVRRRMVCFAFILVAVVLLWMVWRWLGAIF